MLKILANAADPVPYFKKCDSAGTVPYGRKIRQERESRKSEIKNLVCIAGKWVDLHHIRRESGIQVMQSEKVESLKNENQVQIQDKHTDLHQIFKFMRMQICLKEVSERMKNENQVQIQKNI